jgi:NAD(P)-dependent dehydrogenase (short-subunit alcohol dehydrogenase family)
MTRRALVLGGSGAIGSAVVRGLVARDVATTFTWHEHSHEIAGAAAVRADLTKAAELRALFAGEPFDILVHCAAVHRPGALADLTTEDFDAAVALSGRSAFVAMQELARARRPAHVVFVGALERAQSLPLPAPFAAAQGMLSALAMSFAKELGPQGILVNVVAGGLTNEGVAKGVSAKNLAHYTKLSSLHRLATPDEIAAPVLFLALDNAYMTGKTLAANGGI